VLDPPLPPLPPAAVLPVVLPLVPEPLPVVEVPVVVFDPDVVAPELFPPAPPAALPPELLPDIPNKSEWSLLPHPSMSPAKHTAHEARRQNMTSLQAKPSP
jgi:hypothetical protein